MLRESLLPLAILASLCHAAAAELPSVRNCVSTSARPALPGRAEREKSEFRGYKLVALEMERSALADSTPATCYPPLTFVTTTLPAATAGSSYSVSLAANGGQPPYTWSFGQSSLPQGFSIDSSGDLTGTPEAAGTYAFNVIVSDSLDYNTTGALTLIVMATPTPNPTPTPTPTPTPSPVVAVTPANASITSGTSQQFTASVTGTSNTAVTWTVSGTGCTGTACGTITSSGLYTAPAVVPSSAAVTVTATSVANVTQSTAAITIVPPQAAGYRLAWEDTFSTLSLCTTNVPGCNWYDPGLWWELAPGNVTDPSGTYVNLGWTSGQANNTNISTASPNGAYSHAWTFGYFEVSMKFDATDGSFQRSGWFPLQK